MDLAPKQATVLRNGIETVIPVEELVVGDEIVIRPGESIPADGIISEGSTSVDESAITGESIPVEKQTGDKVTSATINKTGFIHIKAQRVGSDTTISQIIKLVDEASASKAPIAKAGRHHFRLLRTGGHRHRSRYGYRLVLRLRLQRRIRLLDGHCRPGYFLPLRPGPGNTGCIMVGTGKGAENGILIKSGEA